MSIGGIFNVVNGVYCGINGCIVVNCIVSFV